VEHPFFPGVCSLSTLRAGTLHNFSNILSDCSSPFLRNSIGKGPRFQPVSPDWLALVEFFVGQPPPLGLALRLKTFLRPKSPTKLPPPFFWDSLCFFPDLSFLFMDTSSRSVPLCGWNAAICKRSPSGPESPMPASFPPPVSYKRPFFDFQKRLAPNVFLILRPGVPMRHFLLRFFFSSGFSFACEGSEPLFTPTLRPRSLHQRSSGNRPQA